MTHWLSDASHAPLRKIWRLLTEHAFRAQNAELAKARAELERETAERKAELQRLRTELERDMADHQFAERVINQTYAELEQRIAERTADLSNANALLQQQIAERSRAEAAEREQRILAEGLRDTAAAINSILDLNEILDRILIHIEQLLPYDTASILMIENGVASVVRGRGFIERGLSVERLSSVRLPLERHGNLKEMFETGRPVIIADTEQILSWHEIEETNWIRSSVGAPVRIEGKVIGFVNLDSASPNAFNAAYAEKLLAFADQAGIAIHNAKLFEAIREHASDLEVSVTKRTAEVEQEQAQLQAIMDSMNEGLFGQIQGDKGGDYVNAALLQMTGYSVEEWDFKRLMPATMSVVEYDDRMQVVHKTVFSRGIWQGEWRLRRKDGSEFDAALTTSRVDNQDGQAIGTVTIVRDISQEKVLQEQKSRFVANASHELRTPLTNLITRLYLLRKQPDHLEEHLAILDRVAVRMRNLVEDLLDHSRFERGIIPLKVRAIDIGAVVNDVIQIQQAEAQSKHIVLEGDLPDRQVIISADTERINQAITNLVINAIHYTPDEGAIRVNLLVEVNDAGSKQVVIHVRDNGPGIPADLLPNIFLPFYRGSENNKGTGLGLAIAKEIVEGHGGQIHVESPIGGGSDFVIRLPFQTEGH